MRTKRVCRRRRKSPKRSGLTLIEVIAAIGLLATLLVTTLTAYSRHARQIETSRFRISASEAADVLLSKWFAEELIPYPSKGQCGENGEFRWETERIRSERLVQHEFDVVQLVLTDATEDSDAELRIELAAAGTADGSEPR